MSDMSERSNIISGLAIGLVFLAVVVGIAALAPLANDQFITPVDGRILSIAWWFMLPLGVAAGIIRGRRMWIGVALGLAALAAFQSSLALLLPTDDRGEFMASAAGWMGALLMVSVPWTIGMIFGWTSLHNRPMRRDGSPRE